MEPQNQHLLLLHVINPFGYTVPGISISDNLSKHLHTLGKQQGVWWLIFSYSLDWVSQGSNLKPGRKQSRTASSFLVSKAQSCQLWNGGAVEKEASDQEHVCFSSSVILLFEKESILQHRLSLLVSIVKYLTCHSERIQVSRDHVHDTKQTQC